MTQYEKYKDYQRSYYLKRKTQAFKIIQLLTQCVRCGCDDIRLLEINYKNGGGYIKQRTEVAQGSPLYHKIIKKQRKTDDLELLCRPCNAIHYLETKYAQKLPLNVVWSK